MEFSTYRSVRRKMTATQTKEAPSHLQSQDSRDEILKAGMRLFANRGFHETSMSEVAREARVSKALIFWHFKTKEELFLAVLSRLLEPYVIDFGEEAASLNEREQILKLCELYLLFVRENAGSVRFFLSQILRDQHLPEALSTQVMQLYSGYRGMLIDLISAGQKKGICSTGFSAESAAGFILSALNGLLIELLFAGGGAIDSSAAIAMIDEWLFQKDQPAHRSVV